MSTHDLQGAAIGIFVALFSGVCFLLAARNERRKIERIRRDGQRVVGDVVDYKYDGGGEGTKGPFPVVQFRTPDGRSVKVTSNVGGSFAPRIGYQLNVVFDPNNPEDAWIDSGMTRSLPELAFVIGWAGIIVAAIAIVYVLVKLLTVGWLG